MHFICTDDAENVGPIRQIAFISSFNDLYYISSSDVWKDLADSPGAFSFFSTLFHIFPSVPSFSSLFFSISLPFY